MLQHPAEDPNLSLERPISENESSLSLPDVRDLSLGIQALKNAYPLGEYDCGNYVGVDISSEELGAESRIICSRFCGSRFSGALSGTTFMSCSLEDVDFTKADLAGVLFLGPRFENFDKGVNTDTPWPSYKKIAWPAQLESVLFHEIHAPQGLDFSGGELEEPRVLRRVRLLECRLPRSDFRNAVLEDVCFAGSSLNDSCFEGAVVSGDLQQVNLCQSSLRGTTFAADLTQADLSGSDLAGADLSESTLVKANLSFTDLQNVRLPKDLREVQLFAVKLTDVDLSDRDLRGASLSYVEGLQTHLLPADLSGVHFEGIDLSKVDLVSRQERGLLKGAVFENCELPKGFYHISKSDLEYVNVLQLDQEEVVKQCVEAPESIKRIASIPLQLEVVQDQWDYLESLADLKQRICKSLFAIVDEEKTLYSLHRQIVSSPRHTHQIHLIRINKHIIVGRTVDPEIYERGRYRELTFRADLSTGEMLTTKMIYVPHRSEIPEVREIEATLYEQLALDINRIYTLYGTFPGTKGHILWRSDLITGNRKVKPISKLLREDEDKALLVLQRLRGM